MKKLTALGIACLLAYLPATAQQNTNSIKGTISDTLNKLS